MRSTVAFGREVAPEPRNHLVNKLPMNSLGLLAREK
jgi:hypothetical protein